MLAKFFDHLSGARMTLIGGVFLGAHAFAHARGRGHGHEFSLRGHKRLAITPF